LLFFKCITVDRQKAGTTGTNVRNFFFNLLKQTTPPVKRGMRFAGGAVLAVE
jgi:hypothetical protein